MRGLPISVYYMTKFPVWHPCLFDVLDFAAGSLLSLIENTLGIQVNVLKNHFVISQPKNNFLDAQKGLSNETVLLSTQNKGSNG